MIEPFKPGDRVRKSSRTAGRSYRAIEGRTFTVVSVERDLTYLSTWRVRLDGHRHPFDSGWLELDQ